MAASCKTQLQQNVLRCNITMLASADMPFLGVSSLNSGRFGGPFFLRRG
jgi:hypothetical protein